MNRESQEETQIHETTSALQDGVNVHDILLEVWKRHPSTTAAIFMFWPMDLLSSRHSRVTGKDNILVAY